MFLDYWPLHFRSKMQGGIPTRYIAIDTETTGLNHSKDLVTQIGFTIFLDGEFERKQSIVIDWTKSNFVAFPWLQDRMNYVRNEMAKKGHTYPISIERMQREGMEPKKAFKGLCSMLAKALENNYFIAGHNLFFDETILSNNAERFGFMRDFTFGQKIFDTMCLERANLANNNDITPRTNETIRDYFDRLRWLGGRKVKTNLGQHCATKYALVAKEELGNAHDAEFDSYLVHLLIECWRKKSETQRSIVPQRYVRPQRNY